jgi:hypothetical protein
LKDQVDFGDFGPQEQTAEGSEARLADTCFESQLERKEQQAERWQVVDTEGGQLQQADIEEAQLELADIEEQL